MVVTSTFRRPVTSVVSSRGGRNVDSVDSTNHRDGEEAPRKSPKADAKRRSRQNPPRSSRT